MLHIPFLLWWNFKENRDLYLSQWREGQTRLFSWDNNRQERFFFKTVFLIYIFVCVKRRSRRITSAVQLSKHRFAWAHKFSGKKFEGHQELTNESETLEYNTSVSLCIQETSRRARARNVKGMHTPHTKRPNASKECIGSFTLNWTCVFKIRRKSACCIHTRHTKAPLLASEKIKGKTADIIRSTDGLDTQSLKAACPAAYAFVSRLTKC